MMAAASPEAQKQQLLATEWCLQSWRADVPLGEFEGVTVGEAGLVEKLDLSGKGPCSVP